MKQSTCECYAAHSVRRRVVLAGPVSGFAARYVWPLLWLGMRTEAATVAHRHGPLPAT